MKKLALALMEHNLDMIDRLADAPIDRVIGGKVDRNEMRAAALNYTKQQRSKLVEFEGMQIEVKAPTLAQRELMRTAATVNKHATTPGEIVSGISMSLMVVQAAICCAYIPGTTQKLFDPADSAAMMESPVGGIVDVLGNEALKLMNEDTKVAKNSETTQKG